MQLPFFSFKIGKYWFHNLEQWDLEMIPLLCIHKCEPNSTERIYHVGKITKYLHL